jgi:hypothetical protein
MSWAPQRHYNSNTPCGLCRCDVGDIPWNHFSATADFVATTFSLAEFLAEYRVGDYHPLFDFEGMSPQTISLDLLHICDHHGVVSYFAGSLIYSMVKDINKSFQYRGSKGTCAIVLSCMSALCSLQIC